MLLSPLSSPLFRKGKPRSPGGFRRIPNYGARRGITTRARRLITILLAMSLAEALETTRIHRIAGLTGARTTLVTARPCRAPHHTISDVGLVGGGQIPMPGEVSLAQYGGLFLDELPEFRRHGLEVWRQPLEEGVLYRQSPARHRPRYSGRTDGAAEPLHPLIP